MNKLLKIKIWIETEIVGENCYRESDLNKVGGQIFRANRNEILSQALENGEVKITAENLEKIGDLPKGWSINALPWSHAVYGSKRTEKKIGEFLKETSNE